MKTAVQSKLIKSIFYQPESKGLDINFHDGHTSVYYGVPQEIADILAHAPSPGWYYTRHIKGCYPAG